MYVRLRFSVNKSIDVLWMIRLDVAESIDTTQQLEPSQIIRTRWMRPVQIHATSYTGFYMPTPRGRELAEVS